MGAQLRRLVGAKLEKRVRLSWRGAQRDVNHSGKLDVDGLFFNYNCGTIYIYIVL